MAKKTNTQRSRTGRSSSRLKQTSKSSRKTTSTGTRYGKLASKKVGKAVREMKRGELRSGRSGKKVTNRKQAIAIGLSQARKRGGKVPQRTVNT